MAYIKLWIKTEKNSRCGIGMEVLNCMLIQLYVKHEWEKTFWCKGEEKKETSWNMKKLGMQNGSFSINSISHYLVCEFIKCKYYPIWVVWYT